MPRISMKKQLLEEQMKLEEETRMCKNAFECSNFTMQRLGLEPGNDGYLHRFDEDENEIIEFIFDGKKCKDLLFQINTKKDLYFDPYNNVKLACGLLQMYINDFLKRDTNMMYLSNKNMNEDGQLTVIFDNGDRITGNSYNKDSLKYIDMIFVFENGLSSEFERLKEMDI